MDKAIITMIENLEKNSGKSLQEWINILEKENLRKHGEMIKFLKDKHKLTHGFANLIAHKMKGSDSESIENKDELIDKQYNGKEHFRPIYDELISIIKTFGDDIEISPKNTYVSIRRKKQFAIFQPATKSRFEIGINLKGFEIEGKLEAVKSASAMCSHKINISDIAGIDIEVINWLKKAYENAS